MGTAIASGANAVAGPSQGTVSPPGRTTRRGPRCRGPCGSGSPGPAAGGHRARDDDVGEGHGLDHRIHDLRDRGRRRPEHRYRGAVLVSDRHEEHVGARLRDEQAHDGLHEVPAEGDAQPAEQQQRSTDQVGVDAHSASSALRPTRNTWSKKCASSATPPPATAIPTATLRSGTVPAERCRPAGRWPGRSPWPPGSPRRAPRRPPSRPPRGRRTPASAAASPGSGSGRRRRAGGSRWRGPSRPGSHCRGSRARGRPCPAPRRGSGAAGGSRTAAPPAVAWNCRAPDGSALPRRGRSRAATPSTEPKRMTSSPNVSTPRWSKVTEATTFAVPWPTAAGTARSR